MLVGSCCCCITGGWSHCGLVGYTVRTENIKKTAEEIFIQNIKEKVKQVQKGNFLNLIK